MAQFQADLDDLQDARQAVNARMAARQAERPALQQQFDDARNLFTAAVASTDGSATARQAEVTRCQAMVQQTRAELVTVDNDIAALGDRSRDIAAQMRQLLVHRQQFDAAAAATAAAANNPGAGAGAGAQAGTVEKWYVNINSKAASTYAADTEWADEADPRQLVSDLIQQVQCTHRNAPAQHPDYASYCHGLTDVDCPWTSNSLTVHMTTWITDYQRTHATWRTLNDAAHGADHASNLVGRGSVCLNHIQTQVGLVFEDALNAEIVRVNAGITDGLDGLGGNAVVINAMLPHHIEGNHSCSSAVHVRLSSYCEIDDLLANLLYTYIQSKSHKRSFADAIKSVLAQNTGDGSKTSRVLEIIYAAQPVASRQIATAHEEHCDHPYVMGCSLSTYFEKVLIGHMQHQTRFGNTHPQGFANWPSWVWHRMCNTIRLKFPHEFSDTESGYYKEIAVASKVLNKAYDGTRGTYDHAIIKAENDAVAEHFDLALGYTKIQTWLIAIHTRQVQKGGWMPKPPLAVWDLPDYGRDRFGGMAPSRKQRSLFADDADKSADGPPCFDNSDAFDAHDNACDYDSFFAFVENDCFSSLDVDEQCYSLISEGFLDADGVDDYQGIIDRHESGDITDDDARYSLAAVVSQARRRFAMARNADQHGGGAQQRREVRQQQQGSYSHPRSHTPRGRSTSRGGGRASDRGARGGARGSFIGPRRFQPRSSFDDRGSDSNKLKARIQKVQSSSSKPLSYKPYTSHAGQKPYVRKSPTPSTQPGRQLFDRIRAGSAKLKHIFAKHPDIPELKGVIEDLNVYKSTDDATESTLSEQTIYDCLHRLVDDPSQLSDSVLEETIQYIHLNHTEIMADDNYLFVTQSWIELPREDGTTARLYFIKPAGDGSYYVIVDTGGSRDLHQNRSRFLPHSLRELDPPIEIKMAQGKVFATHVGVVKYSVQCPTHYQPSDLKRETKGTQAAQPMCFSWLSYALYVPDMDKDLAILSVPTHNRLGLSLKSEGDDVTNNTTAHPPFIYAAGQVVDGRVGMTLPGVHLHGAEFRGVNTMSTQGSNMSLLEILSQARIDELQMQEVDFHTGKEFDLMTAVDYLKRRQTEFVGSSQLALDQAHVSSNEDNVKTLSLAPVSGDEEVIRARDHGARHPRVSRTIDPTNQAHDTASAPGSNASLLKHAQDDAGLLSIPNTEQAPGSEFLMPGLLEPSNSDSESDDDESTLLRRGCATCGTNATLARPTADVLSEKVQTPHQPSNGDKNGEIDPSQPASTSSRSAPRSLASRIASRWQTLRDARRSVSKHRRSSAQRPHPQPMSRSDWSNPNYELKVCSLGSGLENLLFAKSKHMRVKVVALCDINENFYSYYRIHAPNATIFTDMRALRDGLVNGSIKAFAVDALNITTPCTSRTSLRQHNNYGETADKDLFLLSCDIVASLRPAYVVHEMTPENEFTDLEGEYQQLLEIMKDLGYRAHVAPRYGSYECGDATSRYRFIAVFIRDDVPKAGSFDVHKYCPGSGRAMSDLLDKPSTISDHLWTATEYVTREGGDLVVSNENSRVHQLPSLIQKPMKLSKRLKSYYTRKRARLKSRLKSYYSRKITSRKYSDKFFTNATLLGNIYVTSELGGKVYSRHGPYVTITREARGMIADDREALYSGIRYPSVAELARFSSFVPAQIKFLRSLSTELEALTAIAGAVTFGTTYCVWSAVCDHAFDDFEKNHFKLTLHHLDLVVREEHKVPEDEELTAYEMTAVGLLSHTDRLNRREPACNWTNREAIRGFFDYDLELIDRIEELNHDGYEYQRDVTEAHMRSPSRRDQTDMIPRVKLGSLPVAPRVRISLDGTRKIVQQRVKQRQDSGSMDPEQPSLSDMLPPATEIKPDTSDTLPMPAIRVSRKANSGHDVGGRVSDTVDNGKLPFKPLSFGKRANRHHVAKDQFDELPPPNSAAARQRAKLAWRLHRTLCPCSSDTFENTVACTTGHGVKQGDSRYIRNCPKCVRFNMDTFRVGQRSTHDTRWFERYKPGEGVCIDGGAAGVRSRFGSYNHVLICICLASQKTFLAYLRGNSAREFVQALSDLQRTIALETGNTLRFVTSDAFSSYMDTQIVAQWREQNNVELLPNPGHIHQWNAYAEGKIRILKRHCRANLAELKGIEISGRMITDPTPFWPQAMEHAVQVMNGSSHSTLEKWYGMPCTPDMVSSGNFTPRAMKLIPFGTWGYLHLEKSDRDGALHPTNERCYYMFNGQYNLLVNKFSNMHRAHVVLTADRASLICSAKVVWGGLSQDDPLADHAAARDIVTTDDAAAESREHVEHPAQSDSGDGFGPNALFPESRPPPSREQTDDSRRKTTGEREPQPTNASPVARAIRDNTVTDVAPAGDQQPAIAPDAKGTSPDRPTSTITPQVTNDVTQPATQPNATEQTAPENGAPVLDADIEEPDALPSLSDLFKSDDVEIERLVGPNAKQKMRAGKITSSWPRWEKYREAKTIGEYKRLGGTSADFRNDFSPTRRFFTFKDPRLRRQHLAWLDDGGELPAFYVAEAIEAALNHPVFQDVILRLDANALLDLEGDDKLGQAVYKSMRDCGYKPSVRKRHNYGGRHSTLLCEKLRDSLHWHCLHSDINDIHMSLIGKDDLEIDATKLVSLRDVPEELRPAMLDAIAKELQGLIDLGTFEVADLPSDRDTIGTKLVLKVKYRADGTFDKNKARLVVQGFAQRLGQDFYSTFSPMASLTAVRMVIAIAVQFNLPLIHMDVPQAFIQSKVDADIYIRLPKGLSILELDKLGRRVPVDASNGRALRLIKALYGLKQSPQLWNRELTRVLEKQGFRRCVSESSVYVKHSDRGWLMILAEVDDLIITGTDEKEGITELQKSFVSQWKVKDWEPLSSFLGIRIVYDRAEGVLTMDVKTKIDELFRVHKVLSKVGSANTPYVEANVRNAFDTPDRVMSSSEQYIQDNFASLVGSLIYISITCRPDITYAVNQMAKGMHNPKLQHVVILKQTLKYLNSHRETKLTYRRNGARINGLFRTLGGLDGALQSLVTTSETPGDPVVLFSDSDYANCRETRKSITGKATYLFGCLTSWQSKRQPIIATSTHEAEIIAMSHVAEEGVWQRKFLDELGIFGGIDVLGTDGRLPSTPLLGDNKATTFTANTPSTGVRSRHIDVRFLKVREYVSSGELRVIHVRTEYNVADFLTKGLTIHKFALFRELLMGDPPRKDQSRPRAAAAA